jgi:hypothetical protein
MRDFYLFRLRSYSEANQPFSPVDEDTEFFGPMKTT